MGLGDIWAKMKEKKAIEEQKKVEEELLRKQVLEEIQPQIKEMLKKKIMQEELDKAMGVEAPKKENKGLKMLADEFKGANLGNNEQMDKLLGRKEGQQQSQTSQILGNDKISNLMNNKSLNTNRDIAGELGSKHTFRKDYNNVIGQHNEKDFGSLIGGQNSNTEKLKQMVGNNNQETKQQKLDRILGRRK